jgi:hypothetical protein
LMRGFTGVRSLCGTRQPRKVAVPGLDRRPRSSRA